METDARKKKEFFYELMNKFDFKEPVKVQVIFEDSDEDNTENNSFTKTEEDKRKDTLTVNNKDTNIEHIKKDCKKIEIIQPIPVIAFEDIQERESNTLKDTNIENVKNNCEKIKIIQPVPIIDFEDIQEKENNTLNTIDEIPNISKEGRSKIESEKHSQIAETKSFQDKKNNTLNIKVPDFIKTETFETIHIDSDNDEYRSNNNKTVSITVIEKSPTVVNNSSTTKINEKALHSNSVVQLSIIESAKEVSNASSNKSVNALTDIDIDSIINKAIQNATTYQVNQNDPKKRKLEDSRNAPLSKRTTNNSNSSNTSNTALTYETNLQITKCVTDMLETVSQYIINIVRAYYHMRNKLSLSKTESEKAHCQYNFNRYKYHLFHLLFCSVENIILPHLQNKKFVNKFLKDTVTLGETMHGFTQLKLIVEPIFTELINWTKEKQATMKKVHSVVETEIARNHQQDHPLLKRHLTRPSMSILSPNSANKQCPAQSGNYSHACVSTPSNNSTPDPRIAFPAFNQRTNQLANYNNRSHQNGTIQNPAKVADESEKNVLFSYGPPSRRLSITIGQSSIPVNSDSNSVAVDELIQNSNINQNQNYSHHLQDSNANSYPQQPQTQFQQTFNNYNNSPCSRQVNPIPSYPPPQYSDHHPKTVTSVVFQNQKSTNANSQSSYNASEHLEASSNHQLPELLQRNTINNQFSNAVAQHGQNQGPSWRNYQQPVITLNQPLINVQIEQNNSEITRARSTDSGFASPVYFNNGNDQTVRKDTTSTQVTLNVEGSCYLCGAATKKMCLGCFKRYYCSAPCQSLDWPVHKNECNMDN